MSTIRKTHFKDMEPLTTGCLNAGWEKFEQQTISKEAPEIQRTEMRRAFYSGVLTLLSLMAQANAQDLSEDEAGAFITQLDRECYEFFNKDIARAFLTHMSATSNPN